MLAWVHPAEAESYPRVIAHGCGAIQGDTVTNSQEALEQAIANGYTYIEVDLAFTSDGNIAMIHDWASSGNYYLGVGNKAVSYERYAKSKVLNQYTPLTMERLAKILEEHPQVHIITDTKENNVNILSTVQKQYPQLIAQIIPQIYQYSEYDAIKALGYKDIILTLYKMSTEQDGNRVAKFAKEHSLFAVTMAAQKSNYALAKTLQGYGVAVYMHTVNTLSQAMEALNAGAYGIYTDNLFPEEVTYPGWQYYLTRSNDHTAQLSAELQQDGLQLYMNGATKSSTVVYRIQQQVIGRGTVNTTVRVDLTQIPTGKYTMEACIYNKNGQQIATKRYGLRKDNNTALLVAPQCMYILDQFNVPSDFARVLEGKDSTVRAIAQKSLFLKCNSAVYYNNGRMGVFLSGNRLLTAISADDRGNVYTSLYDTAIQLGASKVQMNNTTKAMEITYQGQQVQAGITGTTKQYRKALSVMKTTVQLYRNRAMATGAFYQELTGRKYLQQDGYLILLPKEVSIDTVQSETLLTIAKELYE